MDIDVLAIFFNKSVQKVNDVLNKYQSTDPFNYFKQVEHDIERFKQFGCFKQNDQAQVEQLRTVKQERRTKIAPQQVSTSKEALPEHVHIVKLEMPPPTMPLKTIRKPKKNEEVRITRSKIKKETEKPKRTTRNRKITLSEETNINRDSDVILQTQEIVTISLMDNEADVNNENVDLKQNEVGREKPARNNQIKTEDSVRSSKRNTRMTTKATIKRIEECQKLLLSPSGEGDTKNSKSKRTKKKGVKSKEMSDEVSDASIYKDAISNDGFNQVDTKSLHNTDARCTNSEMGPQVNNTTVVSKSVMDSTVVLHKSIGINETIILSKQEIGINETIILSKQQETGLRINETIILSKQQETGLRINETVTLEKPNIVTGKTVIKQGILTSPNINSQKNQDDLMTEDESQDETPLNRRVKKTRKKPIFNPFENSPVKQRVKAFEKLGAGTGSEAKEKTMISRIATQQKWNDKQGDITQLKNVKGIGQKTSTPLHDRNKSKLGVSALFGNESLVPKSASALKASQREFKHRELLREAKEAEALRKRDALLQAQIDEKRLKREEKQLKAQQAREARDLEKQKLLASTEKVREEKLKQVLAEKQHKLAMQREEAERRRYLAAKKAAKKKLKEKNRVEAMEGDYSHDTTAKFLEQKKKEEEMAKKSNKPIYLKIKAPLLPSEDCYDSDDDRGKDIRQYPEWSDRDHICSVLETLSYVDNKMKNTFFFCEATTPDLRDIFANIDPKKLKRTSSAIWKKPPRFTLMPLSALGSSIAD